jgi:hypothetical protein
MSTQMRTCCCAIALLALFGFASADPAAAERRCGEVARVGEAGAELVSVRAKGAKCDTARWVFEHLRAAAAKGWHCHSAGSEASCTRGTGAMVSYRAARHVRECGRIVFAPQSEDGTGDIVATRARCRRSRAVARASRDFGPSDRIAYRARGFSCKSGPMTENVLPSRLVYCRRGRAIVAFERF